MDRLEAMSLLVTAVEEGSLSAAGRKLGVPLPTISRKVSELEAHLKTQLLVRSTRKLGLTEAGASYIAACKRILEWVDEAEEQATGEYSAPRGGLAITAPVAFGRLHVLPIVNDFLLRFPEINVRMTLSDKNIDLIEDHIDMAVRIGELPDSTMVATRVGAIRRVVCGSPAYFKAHGTPQKPDDLNAHMCVAFAIASPASSWTFAKKGKGSAKPVRPICRLAVNTAEAAVDAAVAGIGLTRVLSYQAEQAIRQGKLKIVLQDFEPAPIPVHLMHAGQNILPLKMRHFLEFAAPRIRKALNAENERCQKNAKT
jgi:DNA-binding transcriptional LysR family regulator